MDSFIQDIRSFYIRDLDKIIENLLEINEENLWRTPAGVSNSCGVLVQHLIGNLNHYIGEGIGETGYIRQRDQEFIASEVSKEELIQGVEDVKDTLDLAFDSLEKEDFNDPYPMELPFESSTGGFLVHLYGHLNYHLGQMNYLRRLLSSDG